jgi:ABC-type sugar transport system ATPase subunit
MSLADRIVVMNKGLICQVGTPAEVYDRPTDEFVATFVGSPGMNFFKGEVLDEGGKRMFAAAEGGGKLELPADTVPGPKTLGIRGEYVHVEEDGGVAGRVITDEYVGSYRNLHVHSELGRVVVRSEPSVAYGRGSNVSLRLDPEHIVVFDASREGAS